MKVAFGSRTLDLIAIGDNRRSLEEDGEVKDDSTNFKITM